LVNRGQQKEEGWFQLVVVPMKGYLSRILGSKRTKNIAEVARTHGELSLPRASMEEAADGQPPS
jgi:hypothetical protein